MKNNTEKLEETKLTISLRTGLMHSNKREEAHTQNDHTSYYIGAINYFIRVALEAESLLELQTESKAFVSDAQFRENMRFLVQISEAFTEWLPDYSHAMHNEVFGMNEAEKPLNSPAPEVEQPKAKTLDEHHLQIMANKLSHILGSDKVSGDAKEALQSILCEMSNEANLGLDSPEIIKTSFPLLVGSLEFEHGKGFVHALRALLDSGLVSPIEDELRQYEKRFDGQEK